MLVPVGCPFAPAGAIAPHEGGEQYVDTYKDDAGHEQRCGEEAVDFNAVDRGDRWEPPLFSRKQGQADATEDNHDEDECSELPSGLAFVKRGRNIRHARAVLSLTSNSY